VGPVFIALDPEVLEIDDLRAHVGGVSEKEIEAKAVSPLPVKAI
jgi:hypothetical protein